MAGGNGFLPVLAGVGALGAGEAVCIGTIVCGVLEIAGGIVVGGVAIYIDIRPAHPVSPPMQVRRLIKVDGKLYKKSIGGLPGHVQYSR